MMRFLRLPRRVWRPVQDDWREPPFEAALLAAGCCFADMVQTAASVRVGTGGDTVKQDGTSGEAITAGQLVSLDPADTKCYLHDANSGTSARKTLTGVAVSSAPGADQAFKYQTEGTVNPGGTVVVGTTYIGSATPGGIAPDADAVSGWQKNIVGVGLTSTTIKLKIFNSGAAVP